MKRRVAVCLWLLSSAATLVRSFFESVSAEKVDDEEAESCIKSISK